jgi:hypothetical protein
MRLVFGARSIPEILDVVRATVYKEAFLQEGPL